jgi:polysaccharide export outer membrane protein
MAVFVLTALGGCAVFSSQKNSGVPSVKEAKAAQEEVIIPKDVLHSPSGQDQAAVDSSKPAPGQVPPASPAESSTGAAGAETPYKIGPGDILVFRSFDDEKLSGQVPVRYDGVISLPLVPDIKVEGLTREEAQGAIREAYSRFYFEPQITLTVAEVRSKFFTVMGDVSHPSQFPYARAMSLLDSIIMAGGLRINLQGGDSYVGAQGQLVKALIIRHKDGNREVTEYDLRKMKQPGPHASDVTVLPNDIVYIPESVNLVYLLGEVGRPSVFALSEGMTLLPLLARGGGFRVETARLGQVVLIRQVDEEHTKVTLVNVKEILKTGQDIALSPGDVIYIPQKKLVKLQTFVSRLTGTISPVLSLQQQVLGLYMQAYDAYYTKERFNRLFKTSQGNLSETLSLLQSMRDLSAFSIQQPLATGATK